MRSTDVDSSDISTTAEDKTDKNIEIIKSVLFTDNTLFFVPNHKRKAVKFYIFVRIVMKRDKV